MARILLSVFLFCLLSNVVYAIDGCNGCHDEKWQSTPAHIWLETEHHIDIVACPDCHQWKEGNDLPPVLPSQETLQKECGQCHTTPDNLPAMMHMQQYQQYQQLE